MGRMVAGWVAVGSVGGACGGACRVEWRVDAPFGYCIYTVWRCQRHRYGAAVGYSEVQRGTGTSGTGTVAYNSLAEQTGD